MDTRKRETYPADISITLLKPPLSARGVLSMAEMSVPTALPVGGKCQTWE